jgi:hypothetical protein
VTAGDCEWNFEYVQQAETIYGEFEGTLELASDTALPWPYSYRSSSNCSTFLADTLNALVLRVSKYEQLL